MEKNILYFIIISLSAILFFDILQQKQVPQVEQDAYTKHSNHDLNGKNSNKISQANNAYNNAIPSAEQNSGILQSDNKKSLSKKCINIPSINSFIDCNNNMHVKHEQHDIKQKYKVALIASWLDFEHQKKIQWRALNGKKLLNTNDTVTMVPQSDKFADRRIIYHLDKDNYLHITLEAKNLTKSFIAISIPETAKNHTAFMSHEGFIAYTGNGVNYLNFSEIISNKNLYKKFGQKLWTAIATRSWAISVANVNNARSLRVLHTNEKLQSDILTDNNKKSTFVVFIGKKNIDNVTKFMDKFNVPDFERIIDFGWLYFIVKPVYICLSFFADMLGNIGWAIILITIIIKALMLPISVKVHKLRHISPRISEIQRLHAGNREKVAKEIFALYKKEKISPMVGCLPILIQMPMFFALYKSLYISSQMVGTRFLIFNDLSQSESNGLLNLFGLLGFDIAGIFSLLNFGILGILLALTMHYSMSTAGTNSQFMNEHFKRAMQLLPISMLFVSTALPSGLILYWVVNNTITIIENMIFKNIYNKSNKST